MTHILQEIKMKELVSRFSFFLCEKKKQVIDRRTDGQTNKQTDGWTEPLIEMQGRI